MKELDNFTVERLERYVAQFKEDGMCDITDDEIMPLIEIALAAKQAKPDYYIIRREFNDAWGPETTLTAQETQLDASKCKDDHGGIIIPVYTTRPHQQLPDGWVLVPKEMTDDIGEAIARQANCCGGIALDIYEAIIAKALGESK